MNDEIQQFRKRVLQFVLVPFLPFLLWLPFGLYFGPGLLERAKGPSAQTQTDHSFSNAASREYDLLFLGNSRIYRGVNPDRFSIPTYNFACDNDTYNQMYHKLKWLRDRNKKFQYLAIGVDYFQFEFISYYRNHLYGSYLGEAYLADYEPRPFAETKLRFKKYIRSLNPKYLFMPDNGRTFLRDNGQYIKPGVASPSDRTDRTTVRLPIQVEYFERMLADCREHGTPVFLCMLPIRVEEMNAYRDGDIEEFMEFIHEYTSDEVILVDYSFDDQYVMADYTDITHLNEAAADRLSTQLNDSMTVLLNQLESRSRIAAESPVVR
ncbi:MAG: hypothetical protein MK110_01060 [Fuerstiella sp.]|nr:hypothetical protein [Fuerstiella sp.]